MVAKLSLPSMQDIFSKKYFIYDNLFLGSRSIFTTLHMVVESLCFLKNSGNSEKEEIRFYY